jgi:hypothetical protein|tara:strand:- start:725 stop:994 length:270 start_codon:yes stop_codon:yes gene_type:complete
MVNIVISFLNWYNRHLTESLAISAFILYLQIPHTISAAECFFDGDVGLYGFHPISDFLLYGIDLLELIPIVGVTIAIIARMKSKYGLSQ